MIWSSEGFPVSNDGERRSLAQEDRHHLDNGTVFRVVSFGPGVAPRNHRTDSIDYAVVISGEIDMELDIGSVHLKAGDVLVQRGTIHNWVNKGTAPCVIAFTLVVGQAGDRRRQDAGSARIARQCSFVQFRIMPENSHLVERNAAL